MNTRTLRTLVQISKVISFAKAAEDLNMTLSALSMQMKSLEAELGASLFDRSVRPPRLTPIGRSIVSEAIPLLQREDRLVSLCRPGTMLVGRFRLGFVTTAAVRFLPPFLSRAKAKAPEASFEFETGLSRSLQERVLNGQIDAAVLTDADGVPDSLSVRILREEPLVFAAHKELLGDGLDGLLAQQTFFHFMPDTGIGKLIASEMRGYSRPSTTDTIVLDNLEAIMECVVHKLGFTLLPQPDVTRYRSTDIVVLPAPNPLHRRLVLASLRNGPLAPREAALADLLVPCQA